MKRRVLMSIVAVIAVCSLAKGTTWHAMESGTTAGLADVWGTASNNVFAVGFSGTILHYDGDGDNDESPDNIWEQMSSPTDAYLFCISGSGQDDVYAVGHGTTGPSTIIRYNGSDWADAELPLPDVPYDIYFEDIWVSGSDVFASGYGNHEGQILHWKSGNLVSHWSFQGPLGYNTAFCAVWGRSADDVYVSGINGLSSGAKGFVRHYNGSTWELFFPDGLGDHDMPKTRVIGGIWGFSDSSELFLAGQSFGGPSDWFAEALYYNGATWQTEIFQESHVLKDVWGTSREDVYMVGYNGMILHGKDFFWSQMESGTTEELNGVWGTDTGAVFVVGENGTILYVPEPAIEATIDIDPDTLNLKSKGRWITCYIWLPEEYDVAEVDPDTILLNGEVGPAWTWIDEAEQMLMVKFSRSQVQQMLEPGQVELTVTGELTDGTPFEGSDTIRVIERGKK